MTFTLTATHTLAALASAASSVTMTVCGDEILTVGTVTTDSFKTLDQRQVPSAATVIYTVPASSQAVIKTIALANTTVGAVTVTLFVDGLVDANRVVRLVVPANGSAYWTSEGWQVLDSAGASVVTSTIAITGDATGSGTGTIPLTLATVNANVGTFGSASSVAQVTENAKGLTTAAASVPIQIATSQVTGFDTQVRTNRLDQMATPTTGVGMGSQKLTSLADGTVATDGVNLGQLTAAVEGRKNKDPVYVATTVAGGNITLSGEQTIDGFLTSASRVLVKNQTLTQNNGLYTSAAGAWTRTLDANTGAEITLATVLVQNGTTQQGDVFTQTLTVATIGTDPQTWVQTGEGNTIYTADGSTLQLVGTQFSEKDGGTTNAKLANMGDATFKMRALGAGTGPPIDGTPTQAKTALAIASTDVSGLGALATVSNLTGPVTSVGAATAVTASSITNAMQSNMAANTMSGNHTAAPAAPADNALAANQFFARSSTGDITAKSITDTAFSWLVLSSVAAQTAALNAATALLQGMMSAQDKIRMGAQFDAQADLGYVGDLITTNSTTSASTGTPTTITDSANPFQPFASNLNYYVGKRITLAGAGAAAAVYVGTITAVGGAGTITVTPGISTTVTNRIASFGTDNTAAVAAHNLLVNTTNALFPSVNVRFGQSLTNAYGLPTPLSFIRTGQIEGIGGGHTADTGDYSRIGGTRLAWWGTSCDGGVAFGAVVTFSPTGVQSLKKPAMRSCWIDCRNGDQNNGLIGLKMASCQGWALDDFFVMDPMAIGIWYDVATSPTEARDCTRGLATNLGFRCLDNTSGPVAVTLTPTTTSSAVNIATAQSLTLAAANGIRAGSDYIWVQTIIGKPTLARYTGGGGTTTLTGVICAAEDAFNNPTTAAGSNVVQCSPSNSCAIYLNGGTGANTCCNTFIEVAISHGSAWGPGAVEFGNSDSNDFQSPYVNGGTRAIFGGAPNNRQTKPGIRMNGSNTSASLASRNNTFKGGDPGSLPITNGGAEFMGALNTGAMMLAPSGPSYWELHQMGNGAPPPTVEVGASLFWSGNGMFREGGLNSVVANQALTAAVANVVTGCSVVVPPQAWQVGTTLRWKVALTKTAVGIAWTANIRQHSSLTAGGGTLIATAAFTATAAIDSGWLEVELVCTNISTPSAAVALARYRASHNLSTAAGLYTGAVTPAPSPAVTAFQSFEGQFTMATFNAQAPSGGPTFLFLEIVPTTAATVMTVLPPSHLECLKAANP